MNSIDTARFLRLFPHLSETVIPEPIWMTPNSMVDPLPKRPIIDRTYPEVGAPIARPMSPINVPTPPRTPMVDRGASRFDVPSIQPRPMDYHPHAQYYDETSKAQEQALKQQEQAMQKQIQSKRVPLADDHKTPMKEKKWDGKPHEGNRWKPDFSLNEYGLPRGLLGARDEQGRQTHRGLFGGIAGWAKDFFNDPSRVALTQAGLTALDPNSYYDAQGFSSGLGGLNRALAAGVKTYQDLANPIGGQRMSEYRRTLQAYNALPEGHPDKDRLKMRLDWLVRESDGTTKTWNSWLEYSKMLPPEKRNANEYQKFVRSQQWLDTGPEFTQPSPLGGGQSRTVKKGLDPKDEPQHKADIEEATIRSRSETEASIDLPSAKMAKDNMLKEINAIIAHPNLARALGPIDQHINLDFYNAGIQARIAQLRGKNFMEAYKTLKGGGQITEIEGEKAEAAQARLNQAQSPEDFKQALRDMKLLILETYKNTEAKVGGGSSLAQKKARLEALKRKQGGR